MVLFLIIDKIVRCNYSISYEVLLQVDGAEVTKRKNDEENNNKEAKKKKGDVAVKRKGEARTKKGEGAKKKGGRKWK